MTTRYLIITVDDASSIAAALPTREAILATLDAEADNGALVMGRRIAAPTTPRGWAWRVVRRVRGTVAPDGSGIDREDGPRVGVMAVVAQVRFWDGWNGIDDANAFTMAATALRSIAADLATADRVRPIVDRFTRDTGADMQDIVAKLTGVEACAACVIEGQEASCVAWDVHAIGRRLRRLLERARGERAPRVQA